ncbi:MAG: hypothetical protein PUD36_06770 [Bacteroidales bacterium]|nr:hypothetical protein [Bacteroidales bacterium]
MSYDNTNQAKKDKREWLIMNLFVQSYRQFPLGRIAKSERPDFIVTHKTAQGKTKRIGIELTELKYERNDQQFNMRAHEDFLSKIMDGAQEIFGGRHDMVLNVDVHFSDSLSPMILGEKSDSDAHFLPDAMAETIANIVEDNLPESTGKTYRVDRSYKYGDLNLPQHIESITISNVTGRQEEPLWYASMSTHVKPLSVESISQRIKDKDEKMAKYDSTCDELWLIIIQNSFLMSRAYDPNEARHALQHRYRTRFNRVFVFERSQANVKMLNILRKMR